MVYWRSIGEDLRQDRGTQEERAKEAFQPVPQADSPGEGPHPQGGTNLYGILFADLGLADNTGGVKWGAGLGFQLDLDLFGALLPSLRLDYAFSPESPTGRLHFRIGPMF